VVAILRGEISGMCKLLITSLILTSRLWAANDEVTLKTWETDVLKL